MFDRNQMQVHAFINSEKIAYSTDSEMSYFRAANGNMYQPT